MGSVALKVGELARRSGLSVRTLHHYDQIVLLSPSYRSEAGFRLYAEGEIVRLQQILSLRQLGFSLEEIRIFLARPGQSLERVIELHVAELRLQINARSNLCARLEALAKHLRTVGKVTVEEILQTMEEMKMVEKYYTPEQLEELKQRAQTVGEERIRQVEAEWPALMAKVRAEMDKGTDPSSETVQALARRWMGLVQEFTGGNPAIEQSLKNMYQQEEVIHGMEVAPMREMGEYISKALAASQKPD